MDATVWGHGDMVTAAKSAGRQDPDAVKGALYLLDSVYVNLSVDERKYYRVNSVKLITKTAEYFLRNAKLRKQRKLSSN